MLRKRPKGSFLSCPRTFVSKAFVFQTLTAKSASNFKHLQTSVQSCPGMKSSTMQFCAWRSILSKRRISLKIAGPLVVQVDPAGCFFPCTCGSLPCVHSCCHNVSKIISKIIQVIILFSSRRTDQGSLSEQRRTELSPRSKNPSWSAAPPRPRPVPKRLLSWHTLPRKVPKGVCCGQTRPKAWPCPCKAIEPWVQMPGSPWCAKESASHLTIKWLSMNLCHEMTRTASGVWWVLLTTTLGSCS